MLFRFSKIDPDSITPDLRSARKVTARCVANSPRVQHKVYDRNPAALQPPP